MAPGVDLVKTLRMVQVVGIALIIFLLGAMSGSGFYLAWHHRQLTRKGEPQR